MSFLKLQNKKITLFLLTATLIFSINAYANKHPNSNYHRSSAFQTTKYKEFFKYFEPVDTIFFNFQNLIIGDIDQFIYLGKSCVINDLKSDSLFYVDLESKKYFSLKIEEIAPGYKLKPLALKKYGKNGFVVASDPYQYIFFENNRAMRMISNKNFRASPKFAVGDNCLYIYQHPTPQQIFIIKMDIHSGKAFPLFQLNEFGKNIRNILFRNPINGGFLFDGKSSFLIANAFENKIYKYNLSGRLENLFRSELKDFKAVKRDIENSSMEAVLKMWRKLSKKDMLISIYLLNEDIIIASCAIDNMPVIELFNKNTGRVINKKKINLPFPIKYCSDDLLFLECFPAEEAEGQFSNPFLLKFKYKANGKTE
jgi:hypothetical protein